MQIPWFIFLLVSALESLQSAQEIRTRKRQRLNATASFIAARHGAELSPASFCWLLRPGLGAHGHPLLPCSPHPGAAGQWEVGSALAPVAGHALHAQRWGHCASPPATNTPREKSAPAQLRCCSAIGSVGRGGRNALFPFQGRPTRCGGAAGTASASGWFPSISFPRARGSGGSSATERCVCICVWLADHICLRKTACFALSVQAERCSGHPSSVQLGAGRWLRQSLCSFLIAAGQRLER